MGNIQQDIVLRVRTAIVGNIRRNAPLFLLLIVLLVGFSACASDANLLGSGSWQASTLTAQHIQALAVDPIASQKLYAGSEDGTLFISSDSGQHWLKQNHISSTPIKLQMLAILPSGKSIYALTDHGLYVSTDAAQTWQIANTSNSGLPADSYTTMTFNEQKSIYVGTLHHGVFTSDSNNPTHWQAINSTLPAALDVNELAFDSTKHRLWAATSLGVYRSDNEGVTWEGLNTGLPIADGVTSIQSAANFGGPAGLVYAGTKHGIFRSMDSGMHWIESGQVLHGVPIEHILIDFRSTNASTLYAGTRFGVFRSDDNGENWLGVAAGFPQNTSVYALAIGADQASQLYVAANNVYLFPGTGNGINLTRIITLLLILLFFVLLALVARRSFRRRKTLFRPIRSLEVPSSPEN